MITAISMVKNSADIIESFIRCNSHIIDNFVILDNMSTDRTIEILLNLVNEGYEIEILNDTMIAKAHGAKLTRLLYYCQEKYNSDFYIPIDDDEIFFNTDPSLSGADINYYLKSNCNTRNLIHVKWRNYFPFEEDDNEEICIPKRQSYYFDEGPVKSLKCIISKAIIADGSFQIFQGNHSGGGDLIEEKIIESGLLMAHYPCRSIEQVISKVVIGWLANLSNSSRGANWGYHLKYMFDMIKSGDHDHNLMKLMAIQYLGNDIAENDMIVKKNRIPLDEKYFEMRYTGRDEFNSLNNIIMFAEKLALELAEMSRKG